MKNKNGLGIDDQMAALAKREAGIRAKMALLREQGRKREQQTAEKEQSIIGAAVVAAAAVFPEFKAMIAQTALRDVDGKTREFLTARGWEI